MVVTVFSVRAHAVVVLRVSIVETGISLMELDCHSLEISSSLVELRELLYIVETIPPHHLVFIVAVLVQPRFLVITTQRGNQSL